MLIETLVLLISLVPYLLAAPPFIPPPSPPNPFDTDPSVRCFSQPLNKALLPPDEHDCYAVLLKLLGFDEFISTTSITMTHLDGVVGAMKVPIAWSYKTCKVVLDFDAGMGVEVTTLEDIGRRGERILRECKGLGLGGRSTVGENGLLHIFVTGGFELEESELPMSGPSRPQPSPPTMPNLGVSRSNRIKPGFVGP
ncbi:hypothetical protein MMC06_002838 [Schaereria dolodes]|nr:hypothetical protein [Schaereria dolodes]